MKTGAIAAKIHTRAFGRMQMLTRQPLYINTWALSRTHCCNGKAVSITYYECACICSLDYPAFKAYVPYCHLWHAPLYNIFPRYLTNGTIFGEKVTEHKMRVLVFSTNFV
jgi:hypothetical protein